MLPPGACRTSRASTRRSVSCRGLCASSICPQIPHVPAPTCGAFRKKISKTSTKFSYGLRLLTFFKIRAHRDLVRLLLRPEWRNTKPCLVRIGPHLMLSLNLLFQASERVVRQVDAVAIKRIIFENIYKLWGVHFLSSSGASGGSLHRGASFKVEKASLFVGEGGGVAGRLPGAQKGAG